MRFTTTAVYAVLAIFSTASSSLATPVNIPRTIAPRIFSPSQGDLFNHLANIQVQWDPTGFQPGDVGTLVLDFNSGAISGPLPDLVTRSTDINLADGSVITSVAGVQLSQAQLDEANGFRFQLQVADGTVSDSGAFSLE